MKIELNLKDVKIELQDDGTYSYRINKTIVVEGIETPEKALESVQENIKPLLKGILKNKVNVNQNKL